MSRILAARLALINTATDHYWSKNSVWLCFTFFSTRSWPEMAFLRLPNVEKCIVVTFRPGIMGQIQLDCTREGCPTPPRSTRIMSGISSSWNTFVRLGHSAALDILFLDLECYQSMHCFYESAMMLKFSKVTHTHTRHFTDWCGFVWK